MEFKVGDRVELIDARGDSSNYAKVGTKGTVIGIVPDDCIRVQFDDGTGTERFSSRFKKEEPKMNIGDKVTLVDGSYNMEFTDGQAKGCYENICRPNKLCEYYVYKVTGVGLKLPTDSQDSKDGYNDTIIRRISDNRVFFVQQQFLKPYISKPKFKRGDFVEYDSQYWRVIASKTIDSIIFYDLTQLPKRYEDYTANKHVPEESLKEVQ